VFISKNLFSQLTVCSVEHRTYSIVSRGLKSLFHHSMRLTINGGLHFLFLYFIEMYR